MKKYPVLAVVFLILLFSCDDSDNNNKLIRKFWAQNLSNNTFYSVDATQLAGGIHCNVWADVKSGVSESTARSIASTYDYEIYEKMINTFGETNITYSGRTYSNTMSFADVDGDNKLCILILDIKDDYVKNVNESYVSGYFWAGNLVAKTTSIYSNQCDMIYIDSNPGKPGTKDSNTTLAHEMQHLMNTVATVVHRNKAMDIWIDEGLSAAAEWVYSGEHPDIRWKWIGLGEGLIDKGNNFYVWGNRAGENQYALLDDYATVYLFFQWLRLQAPGGTSIYKSIITSGNYDYNAVTNAAKAIDANYGTWSNLLRDWMAANYINSTSGPYGYRNDSVLKQINAPAIASTEHTVPLYPGEGVYSITNTAGSTPSPSTNMKYAGLNKSSPQVNNSSVYASGALLTYNINTNGEDTELGEITGIAPSPSPSISIPEGRFASAPLSGPFPIGAGDLLRRNGKEDNFSIMDFRNGHD